MEPRKKSILIALCIGDGYITHEKQVKNGVIYQYNYLEVSHGSPQKEYIEWKADLCRKLTGKKCNISHRISKPRSNGRGGTIRKTEEYRFTCTHKYFRVLRKWMYKNNKKVLDPFYLKYLTPEGLAIWYMDDGCTYVSKSKKDYQATISTYTSKKEAETLIKFFKDKFNIEFHLQHQCKDQYNIRTYSSQTLKFIKLIEPFVPDCMAYKVKVPSYYIHECTASHLDKLKRMKIYSDQ